MITTLLEFVKDNFWQLGKDMLRSFGDIGNIFTMSGNPSEQYDF